MVCDRGIIFFPTLCAFSSLCIQNTPTTMKKTIFAFAAFAIFSLSFSACTRSCKELDTQKAKVIRDCTGTYVRIADVDYLVCNTSALTDYADNECVEVSTAGVADCAEQKDKIICAMAHEYAGIVEVIVFQH